MTACTLRGLAEEKKYREQTEVLAEANSPAWPRQHADTWRTSSALCLGVIKTRSEGLMSAQALGVGREQRIPYQCITQAGPSNDSVCWSSILPANGDNLRKNTFQKDKLNTPLLAWPAGETIVAWHIHAMWHRRPVGGKQAQQQNRQKMCSSAAQQLGIARGRPN